MQRNYKETVLINKFINMIMQNGKKSLAINILKNTFLYLKSKKKNPFYIFKKAITNVMPVLYFSLKKRGAKVFKLPSSIKKNKATFLCFKWILDGAKRRNSHSTYNSFSKKLAAELLDICKG